MSVDAASSSQVAVLGARGPLSGTRGASVPARPAIRLAAFAALALYGTLKWSKLLTGAPLGRLLGLFVLALLLAAGRPALAKRSRLLAAAATIVVLVAAFPVSGVPLSWIFRLRIAVTARAIGDGLSGLPQVLVPYSGADHRVTLVIVLGAAVLLFDAALLLAFSPRAMEELRRAGAALPLIALAAVPTTLVRPQLPYVDGAVLFALLVAFMWGEQIGRRRIGGALGVGVVAVIAAMFAAPRLDQHKPWFNYRALAGGTGPATIDAFDWSQGYGPVDWPRNGRLVLEIKARQSEYWKAENLDVFNGVGWTQGIAPDATASPPLDPSAIRRWTQTISVTIRGMRTSQVIGAGTTQVPADLPQGTSPGLSPGTWSAGSDLGPGDSYRVSVYAPQPSASELAAAGADYAGLSREYLTVALPPSNGAPSPDETYFPNERVGGYQAQLVFPPFHSGRRITSNGGPSGASGAALIDHSAVYGRVYRLAQRLAAGAATPYQFAQAVENYLTRGYTYNEDPPRSAYPLESFLFASRLGYCQQFAGAMALLLRMGGVPARVAAGFTSGRKDPANGHWLVSDYDAHAWVEAWFPHYGWVRFDPTPTADPARSGHQPLPTDSVSNAASTGTGLSASKTSHKAATKKRRNASSGRGPAQRSSGVTNDIPWIVGLAVVVLLATLVLVATKPLRSAEALVGELDAALRRIGRPLPAGATLAALERRVSGSQDAAAYVRALRLARFGRSPVLPTPRQRRAMRRELRLGRGVLGMFRSVWALPPRWSRLRGPARGAPGRWHTRAGRGTDA